MKNLIIVGAGGYGREMANVIPDCLGAGERFVLKGFLDGRPDALAGFVGYPPILGTPEEYALQPDDVFFLALGHPEVRCRVETLLSARGATFQTLVHKTAILGRNVTMGDGSYIAPHAVITADATLGRQVAVFHGSVIGHDCRIGDCSHVSALVFMGGGVKVGAGVTIHPGARIAPRLAIGEKATVGIGSVVIRNVKPSETVFGVPAENILI